MSAMEYEFNLKFKLASGDNDHDAIMQRLGEAGCTDALVGFGVPGYVGLEFVREANSAEDAILSAARDAQAALPGSQLVEAGPDFVGLTDIADLLDMSRQNMRKLFVGNEAFPAPVHGGTSCVWHLAHVLVFLKERKYEITPAVLDVAVTAMHVNVSKERTLMDRKLQERVQRLFA
jgi:hypothetical protein